MYPDRKRFKIVRRDLILLVKRARTLDELLAGLKRKYFELTGNADPFNIRGEEVPNFSQNVNVNVPVNSPTTTFVEPPPPPEPDPNPPPAPKMQYFKCPKCGYDIDYEEIILFCPNCGSSLEPENQV